MTDNLKKKYCDNVLTDMNGKVLSGIPKGPIYTNNIENMNFIKKYKKKKFLTEKNVSIVSRQIEDLDNTNKEFLNCLVSAVYIKKNLEDFIYSYKKSIDTENIEDIEIFMNESGKILKQISSKLDSKFISFGESSADDIDIDIVSQFFPGVVFHKNK